MDVLWTIIGGVALVAFVYALFRALFDIGKDA